jgi:hypothetical protein
VEIGVEGERGKWPRLRARLARRPHRAQRRIGIDEALLGRLGPAPRLRRSRAAGSAASRAPGRQETRRIEPTARSREGSRRRRLVDAVERSARRARGSRSARCDWRRARSSDGRDARSRLARRRGCRSDAISSAEHDLGAGQVRARSPPRAQAAARGAACRARRAARACSCDRTRGHARARAAFHHDRGIVVHEARGGSGSPASWEAHRPDHARRVRSCHLRDRHHEAVDVPDAGRGRARPTRRSGSHRTGAVRGSRRCCRGRRASRSSAPYLSGRNLGHVRTESRPRAARDRPAEAASTQTAGSVVIARVRPGRSSRTGSSRRSRRRAHSARVELPLDKPPPPRPLRPERRARSLRWGGFWWRHAMAREVGFRRAGGPQHLDDLRDRRDRAPRFAAGRLRRRRQDGDHPRPAPAARRGAPCARAAAPTRQSSRYGFREHRVLVPRRPTIPIPVAPRAADRRTRTSARAVGRAARPGCARRATRTPSVERVAAAALVGRGGGETPGATSPPAFYVAATHGSGRVRPPRARAPAARALRSTAARALQITQQRLACAAPPSRPTRHERAMVWRCRAVGMLGSVEQCEDSLRRYAHGAADRSRANRCVPCALAGRQSPS